MIITQDFCFALFLCSKSNYIFCIRFKIFQRQFSLLHIQLSLPDKFSILFGQLPGHILVFLQITDSDIQQCGILPYLCGKTVHIGVENQRCSNRHRCYGSQQFGSRYRNRALPHICLYRKELFKILMYFLSVEIRHLFTSFPLHICIYSVNILV